MSEKLENKNKRRRAYLGLPLCSPAAAGRPSQQAAQPTWPPSSVVFLPDRGTERARRARAPPRHASSLPACLSSPRRSGWTGRHHATPRTSLPLSHSSPSPGSLSPSPSSCVPTRARSAGHATSLPACCLSPPRLDALERRHAPPRSFSPLSRSPSSPGHLPLPAPEALPPPQLTTDALPAVPSPLSGVHELRHDPLHLLVEPRTSGRPPSSPPSSSSSPATVDLHRPHVAVRSPPSSPTTSSSPP